MSSIVIFTSGTNFITESAPTFAALPIKYFLAGYHPLLDPEVTPTSGLMTLEDLYPTSAVSILNTEILYNIASLSAADYSLTSSKVLYATVGQTGTSAISGNNFDSTALANLLNDQPLSNIVSGTSITYNYPIWNVGNPVAVSGVNNLPTGYSNSRNKFFNSISYSPVTSGGQTRGFYKVQLGNTVGNFKYNVIFLFITRYIDSSNEDTSIEPVLFAAAQLRKPIIKSNDNQYFSLTEHDVELMFSGEIYSGQISTFLGTDNWIHNASTNSLSWAGDVVINTSATPGSWIPDAKLTIVNTNESDKAVLKVSNGDQNLKRFFSVDGNSITDDTVYSTDNVTIINRTFGDLADVAYIKQEVFGSSRNASIYLYDDEQYIRGGKTSSLSRYLTQGVSGNSIQIISGGLISRVLIGATSGTDETLAEKYAGLFSDNLFNVFGDSKFFGNLSTSGSIASESAVFNTLNVNGNSQFGFIDMISGEADEFSISTSAIINNTTLTGLTTISVLSVSAISGNPLFNNLTGTHINVIELDVLGTSNHNFISVTNSISTNNIYVTSDLMASNAVITALTTTTLISTTLKVGTTGTTITGVVHGRTAGTGASSLLTIPCTAISSSSTIVVSLDHVGTGDVEKHVSVVTKTPGVGFTVSAYPATAISASDYVNWVVIN